MPPWDLRLRERQAGGCSQPVATHIAAVRPVKTMLV